jgi:preprotein translocase subunit SecA
MTKVVHLDDKEHSDQLEGDYIVDEKARTATLTARGIKKAEAHFRVENLTDADNMPLMHPSTRPSAPTGSCSGTWIMWSRTAR